MRATSKKTKKGRKKKPLLSSLLSQRGVIWLNRPFKLKNPLVLVVVAAVAIIGTTFVTISLAASGTPELTSGLAGKCLDDLSNLTANASKVDSYACNGTAAQQWVIESNETVQVHGKCLDVYGQQTANGSKVDLYACNGGKNEQWKLGSNNELVGVQSGKCLDVTNGAVTNGAPVQIWKCVNDVQQRWYVSHYVTATPTPVKTTPKPTVSATPKSSPTPAPVTTSSASGCSTGGVVAPCIGSATTAGGGWGTPVFDDEFNGTSVNTTNWATSWFGGGKMNGVSTSPSNVSESGGDLVLKLASSSSGALVSTNPSGGAGKGFTMGDGYYAEARVFFPGSGSTVDNWPAFWLDGQSWPTNGEIDVAEGLGQLTSNYHSPQGTNNGPQEGSGWVNGWHTYAVYRKAGTNTIYWDGKVIRSYTTDDGGAPEYLLFNVGSGGTNVTGSAGALKADYVRVWK